MKYPPVLDEFATIKACQTHSIARFGDGEWRCAVGGACTSQRMEPGLARELQAVLKSPGNLMVGIPNAFGGCPRKESWMKYCAPPYLNLLSPSRPYVSSFITRPDNAPWIDTPDYWADVRELWRGRDIVLVVGAAKDGNGAEKKSITTEMIAGEAKSAREIIGPQKHAYAKLAEIEEQIGQTTSRVLICLGTAATVLAYRLARKGIHALDLGHIGMFLRHAGAYRYAQDDMTSPAYRAQLTQLHGSRSWGADGLKHVEQVLKLCEQYDPKTILDYGCGENVLAGLMAPHGRRVQGYDPGIPARASMPKPCDLTVCTDVLEHVEPEKMDAVLDHLYRITGKVAYLVISTRPANATLPDGRNAHLSVHPAIWWIEKLMGVGWRLEPISDTGKELRLLAFK